MLITYRRLITTIMQMETMSSSRTEEMLLAEPTLTSTTGPCCMSVVVLFAARFLAFCSSAALSDNAIWMVSTRSWSCRNSSAKDGGVLRSGDDDDEQGPWEWLSGTHVRFCGGDTARRHCN